MTIDNQLSPPSGEDGDRTLGHQSDGSVSSPQVGFRRDVALYRQGYRLDSVPAAGTHAWLRHDASLTSGASLADVTEHAHPEIAELAVFATETIGLDVASVDLICEDISRPATEQSLGVLELNAEPAIVVHLTQSSHPPRPVAHRGSPRRHGLTPR